MISNRVPVGESNEGRCKGPRPREESDPLMQPLAKRAEKRRRRM